MDARKAIITFLFSNTYTYSILLASTGTGCIIVFQAFKQRSSLSLSLMAAHDFASPTSQWYTKNTLVCKFTTCGSRPVLNLQKMIDMRCKPWSVRPSTTIKARIKSHSEANRQHKWKTCRQKKQPPNRTGQNALTRVPRGSPPSPATNPPQLATNYQVNRYYLRRICNCMLHRELFRNVAQWRREATVLLLCFPISWIALSSEIKERSKIFLLEPWVAFPAAIILHV